MGTVIPAIRAAQALQDYVARLQKQYRPLLLDSVAASMAAIEPLSHSMAASMAAIQKQYEPLSHIAASMAAIEPLSHSMAASMAAIQKQYEPLTHITAYIADIQKQYKPLLAFIAATFPKRSERKRQYEVLLKCGWPPIMHIPIPTMRKLVSLYEKYSQDGLEQKAVAAVNKAICKILGSAFVKKTKAKWQKKKSLARCTKILSKALDAHIRGDYELSVPALCPQLEGIIAQNFGHIGHLWGKELTEYYEKVFRGKEDGTDIEEEHARRFALDVLLAPFKFGQVLLPGLARHQILHGADCDYPTEETSLKVILLLDLVIDHMSFFAGPNKVLHGSHCNTGKNAKGDRVFYADVYQGILDGCKPCRLCLRKDAIEFDGVWQARRRLGSRPATNR
jgi:hypothetical protein